MSTINRETLKFSALTIVADVVETKQVEIAIQPCWKVRPLESTCATCLRLIPLDTEIHPGRAFTKDDPDDWWKTVVCLLSQSCTSPPYFLGWFRV
jgi:hypothetical protein